MKFEEKTIHNALEERKFPKYDEAYYNTLAKKQGAALGQFRSNCFVLGLSMAGTVIGLIVCWIPMLIALLSWPYSIGHQRRCARKIYIEECQKIEKTPIFRK